MVKRFRAGRGEAKQVEVRRFRAGAPPKKKISTTTTAPPRQLTAEEIKEQQSIARGKAKEKALAEIDKEIELQLLEQKKINERRDKLREGGITSNERSELIDLDQEFDVTVKNIRALSQSSRDIKTDVIPPDPKFGIGRAFERVAERKAEKKALKELRESGELSEFEVKEARKLERKGFSAKTIVKRLNQQREQEGGGVIVDGQGFSVRPGEQERFVEQQSKALKPVLLSIDRQSVAGTSPIKDKGLKEVVIERFVEKTDPFRPIPTLVGLKQIVSEKFSKFDAGKGITGKGSPETFGVRVAGSLLESTIPTTKAEIATTGALVYGGTLASVPIRLGVGGLVAGVGTSQALDKSLTQEQRVAGGIIASLGATGVVAEGGPFARGLTTRISGRLGLTRVAPVKQAPEGFTFIEVPEAPGGKIGIIPAKSGDPSVALPPTSALRRGGFGVREVEKPIFFGKQDLATSQIGLVKQGREFVIERPFFTTPREPGLKIAQTRESRLGIKDPSLLKFPEPDKVQIGFGIPPESQIIIVRGGGVGRTETATQFKIGVGTELEAIKTFGALTEVTKVTPTVYRGQFVQVFEARVKTLDPLQTKVGDLPGTGIKVRGISTEGVTRVSGETLLGTTGTRIRTTPTLETPSPTTASTPTTTTKTISTTKIPSGSTSPPISISPPRSPPISPPTIIVSPPISPPTTTRTPPRSPARITTSSPPLTAPKFPTFSPPRRGPRTKTLRTPTRTRGGFGVELRRFGKFRTIGTGLSLKQAFSLGRGRAERTLGATFRITSPKGFTGKVRTPTGFRRGKDRLTFIEKRERRLSTPTELKEIQTARLKLI